MDVDNAEVDESMLEFDPQTPSGQGDLSSISSISKSQSEHNSFSMTDSSISHSSASLKSNKSLKKESAFFILEDKVSLVDLKIGKHTSTI